MNNTIFPFMGVPEDYISPDNEELPIFKEFAWDFDKDEKVIENGDFKIVERNEAIKVWIYKGEVLPEAKQPAKKEEGGK